MTKRSTKRLLEQQQPDPVFFVDRNLGGKKLPAALRAAGWLVETHHDHFPEHNQIEEDNDTKWIHFAGAKGWFILCADLRTMYNPLEKQALLTCGTLAFMLLKGELSGEQMAQVFLEAKVAIWRKIKNETPPGVFKVRRGGVVEKWELLGSKPN